MIYGSIKLWPILNEMYALEILGDGRAGFTFNPGFPLLDLILLKVVPTLGCGKSIFGRR